MVNINIELPEDLHKKTKIVCAMEGISLKDFVINALNKSLNEYNQNNSKSKK